MAISYVSSGNSGTESSSVDIGSLTNGCLIVCVAINSKSGSCSVTYNGVSMTLVDTQVNTGSANFTLYSFILVNPASGSNTLTVTQTGGLSRYAWVSYSGVSSAGQPNANGKNTVSSANNISNSVTTTKDNCWVIGCGFFSAGGSFSSGSNYTSRQGGFGIFIGDTNGVVSPAGSLSQTITLDTTSTGGVMMVQLAISPLIEYTVALDQGSFTHTGYNLLFSIGKTATLNFNSFIHTGYDLLFSVTRKWINQDKNSSIMANESKNSSSWSNESKNSSTFTNENKN